MEKEDGVVASCLSSTLALVLLEAADEVLENIINEKIMKTARGGRGCIFSELCLSLKKYTRAKGNDAEQNSS